MAIAGYPDLEQYLKELGKAVAYVGDPLVADGLSPLGATEGEITVEPNTEINALQFGEETGPAVHDARVMGEDPVVTLPMILGNAALWAKLSPTGLASSGSKRPLKVVTTALVLFPVIEIEDGLAHPAIGPWSPAAPQHALWFWKGYFTRALGTYRTADGGKVITQVQFRANYDATKPDGERLYTRGDPVPKGITVII